MTPRSVTQILLATTALLIAGCGQSAAPPSSPIAASEGASLATNSDSEFFVGEALVGEGDEVAHIDLMIGSKSGPVGTAFANALANQKMGHSNLLAVLEPNLAVKPSTVMITKVTVKGTKQALQLFGPAQYAVAKAVADSVADGVIPQEQCENLVIVCGVFIHWEASDDKKIYAHNYEATKLAIKRALNREPSPEALLKRLPDTTPPYAN